MAAAVLSAPLAMLLPDGPASAGPSAAGPRSALIVGVGKHVGNRPKPTVGGAGDAAAFREVLRRAGWHDTDVRVLVNEGATAANIRAGLQWLQERSSEGSFTVFHYSGHVLQANGDPDRDGEARDEFLVPYDARSLIADRELSNRLRGVRGWLWTDISGCEAAGFDEGGLSGPRRLFTGSSAEHEKSYERPDWKMSVYTGLSTEYAVLQNQGDANRDGVVSIHEAFRYAEREAPVMTARQRKGAQHPYLSGGDGSEWFLRPPAPPPPPPKSSPPPRGKTCVARVCV